MFEEEDLLPISAVQHLAFCPRQCALIHLEQVWTENQLTAEGRQLHERAHEQGRDLREGVLIVRALHLRSLVLGLIGQADVVEFHRCPGDELPGIALPGRQGLWRPCPVEYKRGQPKPGLIDEVQLCCQAICLEEMLGTAVDEGQIFYGAERRRFDVVFTEALRARTQELAAKLHHLIKARIIPEPCFNAKCRSCSLVEHCLPKVMGGRKRVSEYLSAAFKCEQLEEGDT